MKINLRGGRNLMARIFYKNGLAFLLSAVILFCTAGIALADDTYHVTVSENARIDIQITDSQGRSVAPGQPIGEISYIIKSKPENAKVSTYTANDSELESSGKLTMAFSCDKPGTVEVQTFIRLKDVAHYYTGTHTIQVNEAKKEDSVIVIMSIGSKQFIVNNDVVQTDVAPLVKEGRTYVPLRVLSNMFDATCNYDSTTQTITITKGEDSITMTVGSPIYTLNGATHTMDAASYIADGRTMVPIRFIANAFGSVIKPTYNQSGEVADIMIQM